MRNSVYCCLLRTPADDHVFRVLRRDRCCPQIAALTEYPDLLQLAPDAFPEDVKQRAQEILEDVKSVGAYTHSKGVLSIRKHVAEFLEGAVPVCCSRQDSIRY